MKSLITILFILAIASAKLDFPKHLRGLSSSSECNHHGYLYRGVCFCHT